MRRFISARSHASAATAKTDDTSASPVGASPVGASSLDESSLGAPSLDAPSLDTATLDAGAWITPEDGDLRQPLPEPATQQTDPIMPVLVSPILSIEHQEELRWTQFLDAMGFRRTDRDKPLGFEDFTWDKVFPPDRERIAQALEHLVARGDDLQTAIDDMSIRTMQV